MKRTTFLTLVLLIIGTTASYAQVERGDSNIGATTTLSTTTGQDPNTTNFFLILSYEIYITDNLSLGAGPSLFVSGSSGSTATGFGFNFFSNYNFLTGGGVVLPYAGALLNFQVFGASSTSTYNVGMGVKGGMKVFLTERVNLDMNLNYTTNLTSATFVDGDKIDTGSPEGGQIQLFAGIGIILGKKGS